MDGNQILKSDYLDILFQGRNKKYGGYELRKKYRQRIIVAALIVILSISAIFASTLIKIEHKDDAPLVVKHEVVMAEPPPLKENQPPPPPPPPAPPPVRPTVKFTPPVIKPNEEVKEEEKPEPPKKEENVDVGLDNIKGSDDPNAVSAALSPVSGTGDKPAVVPPAPPDDKPLRTVQQMPKAPYDVLKYLQSNIRYPQAAIDQNIQGKIVVEFVVNEDGSITNVNPLNELGGGCTKEAVRVIKAMPKWTPGRNNGKAVKVYYKVPVTFKLQN